MANDVFKYNLGDKITLIFGWYLEGDQRRPIKGPEDTILDRRFDSGEEEYFLKELNTWMPAETILKDEESESAIEEKDLDLNPFNLMFPDLAKKAASIGKTPNLPVVNINGVDVPVIEHFKDIKEYCSNSELFGRWYNRNQFLKYIIGTFESDGELCDEEDFDGEYGDLLGSLSGENPHYCWCVDIYDAYAMTKENLEYAVDETGSYDRGFFLKDKTGKIYFVFTDVD
jgi:hypothetical protein